MEASAKAKRNGNQFMSLQLDPEEHEIEALVALLPNLHSSRVVEVGCGDGRLTRRYAARAASVFAFDPDETAVNAFRSQPLPDNVDLRCESVDRIDILPGTVDVVLLSWSL
jgi:16S rRNA A1518/A1519 N6-dimethyltransferase RsmA/KsgA/DIM1 with predicted DNA glycosylase/AP lyase activity